MINKNIIIDILIITLSLLATYLMAEFSVVLVLEKAITSDYVLALIAGIFFISFFTVVPAGYILINLIGDNDMFTIALIAGMGAVIGDLLIFVFVKNRFSNNLFSLFHFRQDGAVKRLKENKIIRIFLPVLGAAIIASPLPDEIGVALMGASRIKKRFFIPMSYVLNSVGIYILLIISKNF